jgi:hypothetical protein
MKSIFAVIYDQDEHFLVGKTDQMLFFLGGTYPDKIQNEEEIDEILEDKVLEKTSGLIKLRKLDDYLYEMDVDDGENQFTLRTSDTQSIGKKKYVILESDKSLKTYLKNWNKQLLKNQIEIVDFIVKQLRKIATISYFDWLGLMIIFKNNYRNSPDLKKILKKRGLTEDQILKAYNYLEMFDIYIRYQELSLVSLKQLKGRNGIATSQRDILEKL